jgi:propionyl-CoA synthetase
MEHYQLEQEIIKLVRQQIGAVASYEMYVNDYQNTIGKILRKLMRCIADGADFQVPSTIDDESIIITETLTNYKNRSL